MDCPTGFRHCIAELRPPIITRTSTSTRQAKLEEHAGALRPLDPEMASFIVVRALEAVVHGAALDEPERLSDPRFAEEVTELLVRYLEK